MKPLTQSIPGALSDLLRDAPLSPGKVAFAWTAAVGAALDRVTCVRLEADILVVETTSPQWSREVQRSIGVILPRVQGLLGKDTVRSIKVRTDSRQPTG